ncbi:MAG: cyanophycinase [Planctomycetota bacterium]
MIRPIRHRAKTLCTVISLLCLAACAPPAQRQQTQGSPRPVKGVAIVELEAPKGALVIAGGGKLPDSIRREAIALAGGPHCNVVIVSQASRSTDAGAKNAAVFAQLGCAHVRVLNLENERTALELLANADLIWISGGSQNRLMEALPPSLEAAVRARYTHGGVVGGTSAGAAVMSQQMITGKANLKALRSGTTELAPGLALYPGAIVDQHFHRRQRHNRLLSAVLDHPSLLGIGIDEGTAIVVRAGQLRVVGDSNVLIIDARQAVVPTVAAAAPLAAENVRIDLLRAGMTMSLAPPSE